MKKKIFSALLMGVFTLASMSMFVSCKDYDDDINNLDAGQQELLSRIEALEGNVDQKLPEIESSLATAVDNANKALQGVEEAKGLIDEVKTTAEEAGKAAAGAQEDADAAKAVADEALQKAEDALKAIGVDESGVSLVEKVNDLAEQLGTLQALAEKLTPLMEQVEKAVKEDLPALKKQVDTYEALFDNLFAMLTSVELYGTFTGMGVNLVSGDVDHRFSALTLSMIHGNVGDNSTFGDNEARNNDNKTIFATADPKQAFVKGTDIKVNEGVIVRVNPVNAKITGDNVAIKVINSLGQDMSQFIKVASVEPYMGLIVGTRASVPSSGLYKVNFEWVDGVDMKDFEAATDMGPDSDPASLKALFAVAINNTDTVQADRYVASTFDLALGHEAYTPANVLSFKVDNTPVTDIRNRWNGKAVTGDEGLTDGNAESLVGEATKAVEHAWILNKKKDEVITYPEMVLGNNANAAADAVDKRSDKEYFPAVVGTPFTISLATLADEIGAGAYNSKYYRNGAEKIEYYYVTLDENFAGVSAPSELNAWKSYDIDGLYTVTPADQKLQITINSLEANDDKGDKIGFRVFAVNYDGTLVDPDGRAFYVAVGDDAVVETVNVTVKAWKGNYAFVELPEAYRKSLTATTVASSGNVVNSNAAGTGFDQNKAKTINNATIYWGMYSDDDNSARVSDWADAKYLKVALTDLNEFLDNGTFSFTISATAKVNGATRVVNKLNVNVTKAMPTEDDVDVTLKSSQLDANGNFVIRLDAQGTPDPVWTAQSTTGHKDLYNAVTTTENEHYIWTFANAALDDDDKYTEDLEVSGVAPHKYDLVVDDDLIDGKTIHEAKLERNWKDISCQFNEDGKLESVEDFKVLALTANAIFACPIDATTYAWEKVDNPDGTKDADGNVIKVDCNWIYYNAKFPAWFTSNDGSTPNGPQALTRFIKATNTVDQEDYTINGYWSKNLYWVDADHKITAKLISNDTQKEDYFKVTVTSYGNFEFTQVSDTDNPEADVPSTLVITAWDAFGHQRDVAKLPFTVKKR